MRRSCLVDDRASIRARNRNALMRINGAGIVRAGGAFIARRGCWRCRCRFEHPAAAFSAISAGCRRPCGLPPFRLEFV